MLTQWTLTKSTFKSFSWTKYIIFQRSYTSLNLERLEIYHINKTDNCFPLHNSVFRVPQTIDSFSAAWTDKSILDSKFRNYRKYFYFFNSVLKALPNFLCYLVMRSVVVPVIVLTADDLIQSIVNPAYFFFVFHFQILAIMDLRGEFFQRHTAFTVMYYNKISEEMEGIVGEIRKVKGALKSWDGCSGFFARGSASVRC